MSKKKESRGTKKNYVYYCRLATEEQAYGGFKKAELDAMLNQFIDSQRKSFLNKKLRNLALIKQG